MTLMLALTAAGRASVPLVQASGWVSAAHRLKAQHSTGSLPTFQRSGCPSQRALSLPTCQAGLRKGVGGSGQAALFLVCSGRAVHLPSPGAVKGHQPPPARARCQPQDARGGKGNIAAPGRVDGWRDGLSGGEGPHGAVRGGAGSVAGQGHTAPPASGKDASLAGTSELPG